MSLHNFDYKEITKGDLTIPYIKTWQLSVDLINRAVKDTETIEKLLSLPLLCTQQS